MVCDEFFLCATRENTTCSRGDAVCFYSGALPRPRGPRDEAGAPTIALLLMRTPFTNSATLSDPLLGAWCQSITIVRSFRYQDIFKDANGSWTIEERGTRIEIRMSSDLLEKAGRSNKKRRLIYDATATGFINNL